MSYEALPRQQPQTPVVQRNSFNILKINTAFGGVYFYRFAFWSFPDYIGTGSPSLPLGKALLAPLNLLRI
jgi:hypothetical protein